MTAGWLSGHNLEITKAIRQLLGRDEWYTWEELNALSDADLLTSAVALDLLRQDCGVLRVKPPCNQANWMWHGPTPDTIRLGRDAEEFKELPWELKKSYVKKYWKLHEKGIFKTPLWEGVAAHMAANEHLFRIGLLQEHPRPDDGFLYPCMWRADLPPIRPDNYTSTRPHIIFVNFLGRIPTAAFHPYAEYVSLNNGFGYMTSVCAGIDANNNMTRTQIYAGWASVSSTTFELLECTSRKNMLEDARTDLQARAEALPLAVPFRPMRCGFSLLSGNGPGGYDE